MIADQPDPSLAREATPQQALDGVFRALRDPAFLQVCLVVNAALELSATWGDDGDETVLLNQLVNRRRKLLDEHIGAVVQSQRIVPAEEIKRRFDELRALLGSDDSAASGRPA